MLRRKPEEALGDDEREEMERMRALFRRSFGKFRDAEFRNDLRRDMRRDQRTVIRIPVFYNHHRLLAEINTLMAERN